MLFMLACIMRLASTVTLTWRVHSAHPAAEAAVTELTESLMLQCNPVAMFQYELLSKIESKRIDAITRVYSYTVGLLV